MRFVIVTGMSGAGKSSVLKMLEDAGYFCVDNLPVSLISKFAEIACGETAAMEKVALGIDIRNGEGLEALKSLAGTNIDYEILYLECDDKVLVKRYKETRRSHPLSGNGRIEDGIAVERQKMAAFRKKADYIIDTSQLLTRELRGEVFKIFVDNHKNYSNFFVTIHLVLNTVFRQILTLYLMSVFCRIRIILIRCGRRQAMTRPCMIMSCSRRCRVSFWISLRIWYAFLFQTMWLRGKTSLS